MSDKTWYSFRNLAAGQVEVNLYGEIGSGGVTAASFLAELNRHRGKAVTLKINSPGGSVTDGLAIFNALKSHGNVTVQIDGVAASMASYIACAGSSVRMAGNAFWMLHDPTGLVLGGADAMRSTADVLDKMRDTLASGYAAKSGKSIDEIRELMAAESWFNAQEALDAGFVDEITGEVRMAASFDLSTFRNAPPAMKSSTELATALSRIKDLEAKLASPVPAAPDFELFNRYLAAGPTEQTALRERHGSDRLLAIAVAQHVSAATKAAEQLAARGIRPVAKDPQDMENLNADEAELWTRYQSADPITRSKLLATQGEALSRAARAFDERAFDERQRNNR